MQFKQQQQVADEFKWLHMRDLAPEENLLSSQPVKPGDRVAGLMLRAAEGGGSS
ncbi:hypothetical protein ACF8R4_08485 [Pseudomonas sp. FYR_2]|uniref:hypothetical protein n=1 Tax=unclassified Pseudomonas TaxID=196821 RepID=UPI00370CE8FD